MLSLSLTFSLVVDAARRSVVGSPVGLDGGAVGGEGFGVGGGGGVDTYRQPRQRIRLRGLREGETEDKEERE